MANNPIMIRTFHAVGHGCFVTERFSNGINIVYDCGGYKNKITREINNTFTENDTIDTLFISHFDYDHVNGLPILLDHCKKIRNVVIPYLSSEQKIVIALNYLSKEKTLPRDYLNIYNNVLLRIIFEPEIYFSDIANTITKIKPIPLDNNSSEILDRNMELDISKNIGRIKISFSCEDIVIKDLCLDWVYVPFYHFYSSYYSKIINEIQKDSLLCSFIDDKVLKKDKFIEALKNKDIYIKIRKKLNIIFERNGGSNENSLILYSGSYKNYNFSQLFDVCSRGCNDCCKHFYSNEYKFNIKSGCLYFGDYNTKKYYIQDFKFLDKYLNETGIILLPHHGSINNFNDELLNERYGYRFAIACHGKNHQYGFPSSEVLVKLRLKNKKMISVTDESYSSANFEVFV